MSEFTGRILEGRRWSEGIHQAVEAKEGVKIKEENQTLATITLQNYFRMYGKLAGMTGTAQTEAAELMNTYGLNVVPIPTNRPMVREDEADLIYKSEEAKFKSVVDDIVEPSRFEHERPQFPGTNGAVRAVRANGQQRQDDDRHHGEARAGTHLLAVKRAHPPVEARLLEKKQRGDGDDARREADVADAGEGADDRG